MKIHFGKTGDGGAPVQQGPFKSRMEHAREVVKNKGVRASQVIEVYHDEVTTMDSCEIAKEEEEEDEDDGMEYVTASTLLVDEKHKATTTLNNANPCK